MKLWKNIIKTVAPTLASALGGPLAGVATRAISQALFNHENASEGEIEALIGAYADPSHLLKLKELEQRFKADMAALEVDLSRISAEDRDSARKREISLQSVAPSLLATMAVLGFFSVLGFMIWTPNQIVAQRELNILLGALTGLLLQVGNYYFGSSAGSARKTELMATNKENNTDV